MDERVITEQEEQAIRLCHHDFAGLDITDVADKMGVTPTKVKALLRSVQRKAPQLFPILTMRQRAILVLYSQRGVNRKAICEALKINLELLKKEVKFLRQHRFLIDEPTISFDPNEHGNQIKERF